VEPLLKSKVSKTFLESPHGDIACESCHGGNPSGISKEASHAGLDRYPSRNNPQTACGGCHEEIVSTASASLHATLSPYVTTLKMRADMRKWDQIYAGYERHCAYCHTGCGGCHVSRPEASQDGFLNGHLFQKRPDSINQCTACHGSRVGNEYFGKRGQGDVHASALEMDCVSCHKGYAMHAAEFPGIPGRYHAPDALQCTDCHKDLSNGSIREHGIHAGKVQCQVCHAQSYTNCTGCHTGTDTNGLPYYINEKDGEDIKIGLNRDRNAANAGYRFMLVRHIPVNPKLFEYYVKDAFTNFDRLPTWKRTSPHNIQRKTWQNATCNNCHGNRALFLSEKDLLAYEISANRFGVVPDQEIPKPIENAIKIDIDTRAVRPDRVVTSSWLRKNLKQENLVIIDARENSAYEEGHIPGAVSLDPMRVKDGVRRPWTDREPAQLVDPERLARILGKSGIADTDHIVVYDREGWRAGYLLFVLEYAGAPRISFLEGGFQEWKSLAYPVSRTATAVEGKFFNIKPDPRLIVDNRYVMDHLDRPDVMVLDTRSLDLSNRLAAHERAIRPGRIPGSVKFPFSALYKNEVSFKAPRELLYLLKSKGITPEKTIVLTSKTGAWAGAAFFVLRYLGYPDVRVHHLSWVGWCNEYCSFDDQ
jgi:3-mercaptopyruvate sulfurtransferase SseA